MELDLGEKPVVLVKMGASHYKVEVPNVKQAQGYQKMIEDSDGGEVECFLSFLEELGLPKEVAEGLTASQLQRIAEALMGEVEKK